MVTVLLLNGSPRKQGTSFGFASAIQSLAIAAGCTAEIQHVYDYYDGKRSLDTLRALIAGADVIGLVAPLYYDTLPGADVWLFEQLQTAPLAGKDFFVVGQGAYPFWTLCQPLIGACRCFAEATGMRWLGGLGYGGGVLIDGRPLSELGPKGEKLTEAFGLALTDILRGQPIGPGPQELLTINVPKILFRPFAWAMNFRIWSTARRLGVKNFARKVYLEQ